MSVRTKKKSNIKSEALERLTLEVFDAISSDEDSQDASESEDEEDSEREEWNAEAHALRKAIAEGAFDHLLKNAEKKQLETDGISDGDELEVVVLDEDAIAKSEEEEDEEGEDGREKENEEDDSDYDSDEEEDEANKSGERVQTDGSKGKAIAAVTENLQKRRKRMHWVESFCIVSENPLPFGCNGTGSPLDVHDDLKRELAFYNMALLSANHGRQYCHEAGVPFSRPDDFFAEMVKTDDHMAKVKDRLIFETKKMDAVAQRKANKEQKLRVKEKQANKIAEKAKKRKEHFQAVDEWAKSAAQNRGSAVHEDDEAFLGRMKNKRGWIDRDGTLQHGPNKKRMAADKKYGFGGKRGRFKQNDPKTLNDLSGFNPKGNFSGLGSKSKGGPGAKRKGKRARDAARASKNGGAK